MNCEKYTITRTLYRKLPIMRGNMNYKQMQYGYNKKKEEGRLNSINRLNFKSK